MKRRKFIKTVGVGAVSLEMKPGLLLSQQKNRKPNVILVITDDQGYGDLACHGNPIIKTPALDSLHRKSLRLTDFHVSPTCSPTRASLMTGRYCNRTGVWHTIMGRSLLRRDEHTMADIFAANDYRTGIFGKWHLGDNYPFRPQDRGFQEVLIHKGGGVGNTQDYWGNDYFDDTYFHNGNPKKFEGYCTDVWFDGALKFIEDNQKNSFFCYLTTNAPHGPFRAPQSNIDYYKNKGIESPLANFYAMITNIDDNMKRLMEKLRVLGIEDNTILIFMTDNGTSLDHSAEVFNAGMKGIKGAPYDGGHRVPFFIYWPGGQLRGGKDIDTLSAHIDVLPTLMQLCQLTYKNLNLDGLNLTPVLSGRNKDWPDRILVTDSQRVDSPRAWRKSAVLSDTYRLIFGEELYNIRDDAGQRINLAVQHPEVVKKLRSNYEKWWSDISGDTTVDCSIVLGSKEENPTCLTSHDIHGEVVWNQNQVRRAQRCDGFWNVEVAQNGRYEIFLRRWPLELNIAITATIPESIQIKANQARLKIADVDKTVSLSDNAVEAKFVVDLKKGKTRLQTWFMDDSDDGNTYGVYYVYVNRLP